MSDAVLRAVSKVTLPQTVLGWATTGVMLALAWFFWTPLRRGLRWLVFRLGSHLLVLAGLYLLHETLQSRNVQRRLAQLVTTTTTAPRYTAPVDDDTEPWE